jgi:hypothetical protein
MAPIRRYLRISKYSVLECRIFLENPADESRWLLNEKDPALSRIFEAVKPYVLPKLREEAERAKGKGKKKKSIKDVVKQGECLSLIRWFNLADCSGAQMILRCRSSLLRSVAAIPSS